MKIGYFKQHIKWYFIGVLYAVLLSSCQKVINVNLNSVAPQMVIQANLPSALAQDTVMLSQTINFSDPNTFPALSGVFVTITDNTGTTDTLFDPQTGIYTSPKLAGVPGKTYTLYVAYNGKSYTSNCTMPQTVPIDTLIVSKGVFGGKNLEVSVVFHDPAGVNNYYKFVEVINHTVKQRTYITDDELQDGQEITYPLFGDNDSIRSGDSVRVMLESIDKGVYAYYSQIGNASGLGASEVSPANPTSNINNGALGYFSAYSYTEKSIIVQ
jgi:hypothetical protein